MKNILLLFLITATISSVNAQNTWTQVADFTPSNRWSAASFVANNKGYLTTGRSISSTGVRTYYNDTWEYDPIDDVWTQKANFPGSPRDGASAFVINNIAFVGAGGIVTTSGGIHFDDFYTYDAATNIWSQIATFPGAPRYSATSFAINGKGYFGMGHPGPKDDFWEYNPATNIWIQKNDFPGGPRQAMASFVLNGKGYAGTGFGVSPLNDFWEYNPLIDTWIQKAYFGGAPRFGAVAFTLNGKGYIGTGCTSYNLNAGDMTNDIWEYNPTTNSWAEIDSFSGPKRNAAVAFELNNTVYIATGGISLYSHYNDMWKLSLNVGIKSPLKKSSFTVYPNPANNFINFKYSGKFQSAYEIRIYNISGALVKKIEMNSAQIMVDVTKLAVGTYIYNIISDEKTVKSGKVEVIH